jgi:hypothetical protein
MDQLASVDLSHFALYLHPGSSLTVQDGTVIWKGIVPNGVANGRGLGMNAFAAIVCSSGGSSTPLRVCNYCNHPRTRSLWVERLDEETRLGEGVASV